MLGLPHTRAHDLSTVPGEKSGSDGREEQRNAKVRAGGETDRNLTEEKKEDMKESGRGKRKKESEGEGKEEFQRQKENRERRQRFSEDQKAKRVKGEIPARTQGDGDTYPERKETQRGKRPREGGRDRGGQRPWRLQRNREGDRDGGREGQGPRMKGGDRAEVGGGREAEIQK